jgi:hypothetical protein
MLSGVQLNVITLNVVAPVGQAYKIVVVCCSCRFSAQKFYTHKGPIDWVGVVNKFRARVGANLIKLLD